MTTTASESCNSLITSLNTCGLATAKCLDLVRAYLKTHRDAAPDDLIEHLVARGALTRFQARALRAGQAHTLVLANYTLVDVLGTGSMGTVYRARSSQDDRWYAIKTVPRRNVVNLRHMTEQVVALEQVRHPRVSAMVHVGVEDDRVFMVWPYLEGGEKLQDAVRRLGRLPARQAAQIAHQVASGLQAYHEHGLFHGLLKPSDIVIGNDRRVRILDFGVGFLLTCENGKSLLDTTTNSRAMARGLDCASPESILDPLDRTPAGDQYSLGCILYYCLSGRYPFPHDNPVKKMLGHQAEEPFPIDQLAEVPPRLSRVVHRLLAKAPEDRYGSIAEVVQELQAVASAPDTAFPRAVKVKPAPALADEGGAQPTTAPGVEATATPGPWLTLAGVAAGVAAGLLTWYLIR